MKKIIAILWMPVTLLIINFTPFALDLYERTTWFDDIMHTLGGFAIALMLTTYMRINGITWWKTIPLHARILFTACFAVMFGVIWEWREFITDTYFGTHDQPSIADTMFDLFLAMIGSGIYSCFDYFRNKK